jgi:phospholipid-binding lipoprotein MlaA
MSFPLPKLSISVSILLSSLLLLAGCATGPRGPDASVRTVTSEPEARAFLASFDDDAWDDDFLFGDDLDAGPPVRDPLEGLNRAIFDFNGLVYEAAFIPVSRIYGAIMPDEVRRVIRNFFGNLRSPITAANHALQGEFTNSGRTLQRFALNSTVGVLGLTRPSDNHPVLSQVPSTDMGETFARWGIRDTPFLMLPLLGPSTVSDAIGSFGDRFFHPATYILSTEENLYFSAAEVTNGSVELMRDYGTIVRASIDPYAALRDGYIQFRRARLERPSTEPEPPGPVVREPDL